MLSFLLHLKFAMIIGLGTVFWGNGDPQNPDAHLACYHRQLNDNKDFVVAHRTLPCGTQVQVCNVRTGLCVKARVADRGPYGKTRRNGKVEYTSSIDLSKRVAKAIRFNGMETVFVFIVSEPLPKKRILYERRNS